MKYLFDALTSFNQEERQLFLRFVWVRVGHAHHPALTSIPALTAPVGAAPANLVHRVHALLLLLLSCRVATACRPPMPTGTFPCDAFEVDASPCSRRLWWLLLLVIACAGRPSSRSTRCLTPATNRCPSPTRYPRLLFACCCSWPPLVAHHAVVCEFLCFLLRWNGPLGAAVECARQRVCVLRRGLILNRCLCALILNRVVSVVCLPARTVLLLDRHAGVHLTGGLQEEGRLR